jgi:WD40 repeat protein
VTEGASSPYRYWAFISYSQRDKVWADWLFRALETYSLPKPLVGKESGGGAVPGRLFPIFRDREELPGAANLGEKLSAALEQSRSLIVICSPNAAGSRWVNQEIETYKALGRSDRIFALLVGGEPGSSENECFPQALRSAEPIAADVRPEKDGKRNALLKLVAGILGLGLDALKQRDQERRMRRMMLAGGVLACLALLFAGLAFYANVQRLSAEERRRLTLAQKLSTQAEAAFSRGGEELELSALLAIESLRSAWTPEAHELLVRQSALLPGPPLRRWKAHERFGIRFLAVNRARGWLVTSSDDEEALWSLADGSLIRRLPAEKSGSVARLSVSSDGCWLASQCDTGLCVRQTGSWREVLRLPGADTSRLDPGFSGDGRWLGVVRFGSSQIDLYEATAWTKSRLIDHGEPIGTFAFSPVGSLLATVGSSRLTLWDAATGRRLADAEANGVNALAFAPDGRRLAGVGPQIEVWDIQAGAQGFQIGSRQTLRVGRGRYYGGLAFSPSGKYLASTAFVLDMESGEEIARWRPGGVTDVVFGAKDRELVMADDMGRVEIRAIDAREAVRLPVPAQNAVDFSPSGEWLALGAEDGTVRILNAKSRRELARYKLAEPVSAISFSPDGSRLAVIGQRTAVLLDTVAWTPRSRIEHAEAISASGFTGDGRFLVTSTGSAVGLSPVQDGGAPRLLKHEGRVVPAVGLSLDGARLRTATEAEFNRRVGLVRPAFSYIWEIGTGKRLTAVEGEPPENDPQWRSTSLTPKPHMDPDQGPWPREQTKTLKGLDLFQQQMAEAGQAHGGEPLDHSVSPDHRWLATTGADGSVRLWPLAAADLIASTCARLTRNLTAEEWRELQVDDGPRRPTCPGLP